LRGTARWCVCLVSLTLWGCAGTANWPEVDLARGGWTLWTGQALWTPEGDRPPIAGEVIIARRASDEVFVSFSKPPLPIFTARTLAGQWRIDFVDAGQSHAGRGKPPRRFVWFALPRLLEGGAPPADWTIAKLAGAQWSIRNVDTGEAIRLVLDP
jgi:hypothetical protein